jgi:nucleotide-binding universal stress UspA family protein
VTRRWLVAHDGTEASEAALALAMGAAPAHGVGLLLMRAVPSARLHEELDWSDGASAPLSFEDYVAGAERHARSALDGSLAAVRVAAPELDVEMAVIAGEPADAIVAASARPDVERVVMGTHARRGLRHLILGSVAEAVMARSSVPVIVVPPPA